MLWSWVCAAVAPADVMMAARDDEDAAGVDASILAVSHVRPRLRVASQVVTAAAPTPMIR